MRLFEHPDFDQAVIRTREYLREDGLTEQLIEKDYYVTEALRIVASYAPDAIVFKGGTSLSKGWNLIHRFSEDLDVFVNPAAFNPPLGKRAIDRQLKGLRDAVADHPGLTIMPDEGMTLGGFGRSDRYSYAPRFTGISAISARVLLEAATGSGSEPTEIRPITSYVAAYLRTTGQSLGAVDESPFEMCLLHFRRTFVEKMFAIHAKVEIYKEGGPPIRSYARHYYDLACLASEPAVLSMLEDAEYEIIKNDYERVSLAAFPKGYRRPPDLRFMNSDALFPPNNLAATLSRIYEEQCALLCYGTYPSWNEVMATFERLRVLL